MTLTEKQMEEVKIAAKPLMKWIKKNCPPHMRIILDADTTVLVEDIAAVRQDIERLPPRKVQDPLGRLG